MVNEPTPAREREIALALAYFAATYHPTHIADVTRQPGTLRVHDALARVVRLPTQSGNARERLAALADVSDFPASLEHVAAPTAPEDVPVALADLVDALVINFDQLAERGNLMPVHAATSASAMLNVLPVIPEELWLASYNAAWSVSAALVSIYCREHSARAPHSDANVFTRAAERHETQMAEIWQAALNTKAPTSSNSSTQRLPATFAPVTRLAWPAIDS